MALRNFCVILCSCQNLLQSANADQNWSNLHKFDQFWREFNIEFNSVFYYQSHAASITVNWLVSNSCTLRRFVTESALGKAYNVSEYVVAYVIITENLKKTVWIRWNSTETAWIHQKPWVSNRSFVATWGSRRGTKLASAKSGKGGGIPRRTVDEKNGPVRRQNRPFGSGRGRSPLSSPSSYTFPVIFMRLLPVVRGGHNSYSDVAPPPQPPRFGPGTAHISFPRHLAEARRQHRNGERSDVQQVTHKTTVSAWIIATLHQEVIEEHPNTFTPSYFSFLYRNITTLALYEKVMFGWMCMLVRVPWKILNTTTLAPAEKVMFGWSGWWLEPGEKFYIARV